jgi:hypothetical protein
MKTNKQTLNEFFRLSGEKGLIKESTDRDHKYNSITKVKEVLGDKGDVSDKEVISFIKKNYDLDNDDQQDIVGDIMGYYKVAPEKYFDEDGNIIKEGDDSEMQKVEVSVISNDSDKVTKKVATIEKDKL